MSGLQLGVLALIVAAFALGWWAGRGREETEPTAPTDSGRQKALLAADAALAMWRLERGRLSPAARHAMVTAAGRLWALVPAHEDPAAVEPSALRALARALEQAALTGVAAPAPPAVVQAARELLDR